jgi:hypothetical protein
LLHVRRSFGHVLDQPRVPVDTAVAELDHPQRLVAQWDRVAARQLQATVFNVGGSAAAPSAVSSLNVNAIGLLSAGTGRPAEDIARAA